MAAMQEYMFQLFLRIQRPMQTENRNKIYNSPVSLKTSKAELYCIYTNNISRLVTAGFFMRVRESVVVVTKFG